MFATLAFTLAAVAVWFFFSSRRRFLRGFARLIDAAEPAYPNPFAATTRMGGSYAGRQVQLELDHPTEDSVGRIVVAMQVRAADGSPWKDSSLTRRDAELSRATFDLEARYELVLTLRAGWLRAERMSVGRFFPGLFDERRWRDTLAQMHVLANWLERRSA